MTNNMPGRIVEKKRHLDGSADHFRCDWVALRRGAAIVLFRHGRGRSAGPFRLPRGSRTYGFFWPRRPYCLYRMLDPRGKLIAHRFDVLEGCRVGQTEVSYLDLLLDIWVAPDGGVQVEDEEDVAAWARAGLLSKAQQRRIARVRDLIVRGQRRIIREAAALLTELGVDASG
jgi:Protein of unknown function (DUF402)